MQKLPQRLVNIPAADRGALCERWTSHVREAIEREEGALWGAAACSFARPGPSR